MELFGRTLDAQQVGGLLFLLATLGLWSRVLVGEMRERRWVKRRQKELSGEPDTAKRSKHGGPWG